MPTAFFVDLAPALCCFQAWQELQTQSVIYSPFEGSGSYDISQGLQVAQFQVLTCSIASSIQEILTLWPVKLYPKAPMVLFWGSILKFPKQKIGHNQKGTTSEPLGMHRTYLGLFGALGLEA